MNEVLKAIKERRSIRSFKPDMPPKELLEQIVEAGLYAASGMDQQPVKIIAITNKDVRDKLSAANCTAVGRPADRDPFYGGPVVFAVIADKSRPSTYINDGSLVIGNMLLAAHSLGLGSIWIHRAKEEFETEEWKAFLKDLGIEGEWEGIGHCVVGYYDGEYPAVKPRKPDRVYWVE